MDINSKPVEIDYSEQDATSAFIPPPLLHSSQQAGWKNIYLAHLQIPATEIPENKGLQHIISLQFWKHPTELELTLDGKRHQLHHFPGEVGCIEILPAHTTIKARVDQPSELTHCYIEPSFLTYAAYESANPEQVELKLTGSTPDPLIWQIVMALRTVLETDATNSCFYAESMATALAAHLLRNYSIHPYILQEYKDGLPKYKLKQALEYMNTHLDENVSLLAISDELKISQFHFCRLFKQSTGLSPHAYLMQQRVERAKQFLKRQDYTMLDIAIACGFANPSHFAKWFRKYTGVSPKQFRIM